MRAAVLESVGHDRVSVRDDVAVADPGPHEVRIRVGAAGLCHSDVSAMSGRIPQRVPAVLGHEGAGVIVQVGEGVAGLSVGDHVIVALIPPCGTCRHCLRGQPYLCTTHVKTARTRPRFVVGGEPAFGMAGAGMWAEEVVVPQAAAIAIDPTVPLEVAALVGCAVVTGVGAVVNTAQVEPGASVVVFGCGGVGSALIQGARLAGAAPVVGVDPVESKHQWAQRFGATHTATPQSLPALAAELGTEYVKGFDYAFEAVGSPATIRAAWEAARRGGTTVVVGVGSADEHVEFTAAELVFDGKRLLSSLYGSADVRRDFDRIIRLWRAGRLDIAGLVSRRLPIEKVNEGIAALRGGEAIRQVITFA